MAAHALNRKCLEIIATVNNSQLDYTMNQTPYSIHFSIRKKFSKISHPTSSPIQKEENIRQTDYYREELESMKNEYSKVFSFYQVEVTERINLENELKNKSAEINKLKADLENVTKAENLKDKHLIQYHNLNAEFQRLQNSHEKKCEELKHLKSVTENVKKENNELSVALRRTKQENKEQYKSFEKEKKQLEKKVFDLNEFRVKILNEEREEKIRIRKEIKKSKQKMRSDAVKEPVDDNKNIVNMKDSIEILNINDDEILEEATVLDETKLKLEEDDFEVDCGSIVENNDTEDCNVNMEDEEGFLGPKLPPLMSKAEIEEFQKELFAKLDMKLNLMWSK